MIKDYELEMPEITTDNIFDVVCVALSRLNILVQSIDQAGGRMKIRLNDTDDGISATVYWPVGSESMEEMNLICEVPVRDE